MPTPSYLTIEGSQQGLITAGTLSKASVGNLYQSGHENQILVQSFHYGMQVPQGHQHRVHRPLIITKIIDKSSPLLSIALANGERLKKCSLALYRTVSEGKQEHYYSIDLEDAVIVNIENYSPHCQDPQNAYLTHLETLHLAYRRITWTHEACGTMGSDDWRSQG